MTGEFNLNAISAMRMMTELFIGLSSVEAGSYICGPLIHADWYEPTGSNLPLARYRFKNIFVKKCNRRIGVNSVRKRAGNR
jgi:hypothetical protein